jgi:hypothetical protein
MTDPVTALLITLSFLVVLAGVRFFKTLDNDLVDAWQTPLMAGLVSGIVLRLMNSSHPAAVGVLLTAAALYVRLTGNESEPVDGMMLGACSGAAAAIPLIIRSEAPCLEVAECIVAGAVAGYGITFAALHVANRLRQYVVDVVTAGVAVGVVYAPRVAVASGAGECASAIAIAVTIPVVVVIVVFAQWPDVRAELSHEASLGFMDDTDVRRAAHPLLRLGSGGWADTKAHREFVRLANKIALRKRQQRTRSDEVARLYQLEIIKLRMQIEAMTRINRDAMRAADVASDTMARSK